MCTSENVALAPNVQGSLKPCETAKTGWSCQASREGLWTGGRQAVGAAGNQFGPREVQRQETSSVSNLYSLYMAAID